MTLNKYYLLALSAALISGLANFLNKFALAQFSNATIYTGLKNLLAVALLSLLILSPKFIKELRQLTWQQWCYLVLIGIIGGGLAFVLFFNGLKLTSAVNASFIHKTLFIWITILALPWLKEKITNWHFLALGLLFFGNYLVAGNLNWRIQPGDLLILLATWLWAIEFILAKKLLSKISGATLAWSRLFFGVLTIYIYLMFTQKTLPILLTSGQWLWLVLSSVILVGFVLTWYGALKRLPATTTSAILVIASPVTTLLNSIFISHQHQATQLFGYLVFVLALLIIWRQAITKQPHALSQN